MILITQQSNEFSKMHYYSRKIQSNKYITIDREVNQWVIILHFTKLPIHNHEIRHDDANCEYRYEFDSMNIHCLNLDYIN